MVKHAKKREIYIATQIAATPVLTGKEARKILIEAKVKQSEKAKNNAKTIIDYFSRFIN